MPAEEEESRVHVLRDGHLIRGSDYGTVYGVSIVTDGFRLPDRALAAIREYVRKFEKPAHKTVVLYKPAKRGK